MQLRCKGCYGAALALSALLVTACSSTTATTIIQSGSNQTSLTPAPTSQGAHYQVLIQNAIFTPLEISVKPGDTVTWINKDSGPHTITSIRYFQDEDDISHIYIGETWDSGDIGPGGSFSRTFDNEGTYQYFSFPLNKPAPLPEFYQLMAGMSLGAVIVG